MNKGVALIKRGFHEIPHLMVGGGLFLLCAAFIPVAIRRHFKYERHRKVWKRRYTVVREEDYDPSKQIFPIDKKYPIW